MTSNEAFLQWKEREKSRVTMTRLQNFPLTEMYPLIGAEGVEGVTNIDGMPVLPILKTKIYRKMAAAWNTVAQVEQYQLLPIPRMPTEVNVHHHFPE